MSKLQEQIQYDGPERMDREIERKISSGETPLSDNPAFPGKEEDEFDNSFAELIASKRFKDVVDKVKQYTGINEVIGQNALMQLQGMLMSAVRKVKELESNSLKILNFKIYIKFFIKYFKRKSLLSLINKMICTNLQIFGCQYLYLS